MPASAPSPARNTLRVLLSLLLAIFSVAALGLATGAVWMLPTMYEGRPLPWLALPAGWLLGRVMRSWIRPAGPGAALLAVIATLLAAIYVSMLTAGARIAGNLGLDLIDTLRTAGGAMLFELARQSTSPTDWVWFAAGCMVAAWAAGWISKPHPAK
ncbi:hypothetical protein [Dyella tabacisoli]|uniref:Vitamin B12 transport system permease protein n=1 Tax=Dyella tabacisoli TaxID=2282381 RepID=A0A369URU5_9GAMM|nr:hypothetical protein [Dyella tabacisoli]RDD83033.1 hypothetical protein DVJ77_04060 [Dyella tabacisoli]